jgi:hypothetical protein
MRNIAIRFGFVVIVSCVLAGQAHGFGGFRAGGFGGFRAGGFGGGGFAFDRGGSFSGFGGRDFSYSGSRSGSAAFGAGGFAGHSSYDRSFAGSGGGSLSVSGTRGAAVGPWGGVAAGGTRNISGTTPGGRSLDTTMSRGGAMGPGGNFVGGSSRYGVASGPRGTVAGGSRYGVASGPGGTVAGGSRYGVASGYGGTVAGGARWGAAGYHLPTDGGLARYSAVGGYGAVGHSTAFWSNNYIANRAGIVRGGFYGYNFFNPGWYSLHPGAWIANGWAANTAWNYATWPSIANFINISAPPVYLDYGNTIVYQNNNVYVNGTDEGTAQQFNQQAAALATAGLRATPAKTDKWQPLGVFSLVQGSETSSNTMFQLAVDQKGIIRGNYYDALMDQSTPVYGAVDSKTQRAAWTIGDKKTPVFDCGIYNLTQAQTPVLVHFGDDRSQQWLLVRVEQPKQPG